MANVQHGNLSPGASSGIHVAQRWSVANAAARTALSVAAADVGGICVQQDTREFWVLADTTPTWKTVTLDSAIGVALNGQLVSAASFTEAFTEMLTLTQQGATHYFGRAQSGVLTWANGGGWIGSSNLIGTAVARQQSDASYLGRLPRVGIVTASSASAITGNYFYTGDGSVKGWLNANAGYQLSIVAGVAAVSTNMQWFSGLYSGGVIASGATDFTTLTNVVALIGYAGSANVQLAHNDGSGNAVLLDLGANFPARTVGATYRLRLAITKGGTTLYYRVERLDTATTPVTGSFTTEIPAASTFLYPLHTCRNASDAVAVAIDSVGFDAWILD